MSVDNFMLIEHATKGDPCQKCGEAASRHRQKRVRVAYLKSYNGARPERKRGKRSEGYKRIIGVDGEGQGRKPHLYTFLAASDEKGTHWQVKNPEGLTTYESLMMLVGLPQGALIVGYAFLYDTAKILKDLPNDKLYSLLHEETRAYAIQEGRVVFRPIKWRGFDINYINRRLTIKRGRRSVVIWDLFRFFQGKFTQALTDWKIIPEDEIKRMQLMKDKRSEFDKLNASEVEAYCFSECQSLAKLARALLQAHEAAGLHLRSYFGAGSTAAALLKRLGIKRNEPSDEMRHGVASAFFGGRFENCVVGPVEGKIYGYDIASAYPYHTARLPCLEHGQWEHVTSARGIDNKIRRARLALVEYGQATSEQASRMAWGPLPWRSRDGTITFPAASGGGWVWKDEYLAAREGWPNVFAMSAWLFHQECDCPSPFATLPELYRERIRIGKEGKGQVLKLACNSVYGKLAQSKGGIAPFQSWIWAGNITSGTRAQLLTSIKLAKDPWDVLMFATDGVWSRVPLDMPKPEDTGTSDLAKPLGCWESKVFDKGVFCVRPGIYFPLEPDEAMLKEVRARGLGKRVLYDQWRRILETWDKTTYLKPLAIGGVSRFVGAKSALHKSKAGIRRSDDYGEWIEHPIQVSFSPGPKRAAVMKDNRLALWPFAPGPSTPYDAAQISQEAIAMRMAESIAIEQPDSDWSEWE